MVNLSLGGDQESPLIEDKINDHQNTLFVVAAGNDGRDNDVTPTYPCDIDEPNIVCVGASTNRDEPADFSNHGDHSVDLFAPGEWIVSTMIPSPNSYFFLSGTSMAAPHVAAVAALLLEVDPTFTADELKDILLDSVDERDAFADSVTEGRLNAGVAVARAIAGGDPLDSDGDGEADAVDRLPDRVRSPARPRGARSRTPTATRSPTGTTTARSQTTSTRPTRTATARATPATATSTATRSPTGRTTARRRATGASATGTVTGSATRATRTATTTACPTPTTCAPT